MKIETINIKNRQVEYSTIGNGKPILFLHGGHSNCRETLFHKGFDTRKFKHFNSKSGFMSDIEHNIEGDLIPKIKCPTLIIHCKNDTSVSFEHAIFASKMIKNSILAELENEWGHLFWIGNDSNESIRKTIEFIEQ